MAKKINLLCLVMAILTAVVLVFFLTSYLLGYKLSKRQGPNHLNEAHESHLFKEEMKEFKNIDSLLTEEMAVEEFN